MGDDIPIPIPPDFFCAITHEVMSDPVVLVDGHSYEKEAIAEWFRRGKRTSPRTNRPLDSLGLRPNHSLKSAIRVFMEEEKPAKIRRVKEEVDHKLAVEIFMRQKAEDRETMEERLEAAEKGRVAAEEKAKKLESENNFNKYLWKALDEKSKKLEGENEHLRKTLDDLKRTLRQLGTMETTDLSGQESSAGSSADSLVGNIGNRVTGHPDANASDNKESRSAEDSNTKNNKRSRSAEVSTSKKDSGRSWYHRHGIESLGFDELSDIQTECLVEMLKGRDVVVTSPQRSGKTTAFLIGSLQKIDYDLPKLQVLVVVPTRELAMQIHKVALDLGWFLELEIDFGAGAVSPDDDTIGGVQFFVGTPLHALKRIEAGHLCTDEVKMFVLDEASELLTSADSWIVRDILTRLPWNVYASSFAFSMKFKMYVISGFLNCGCMCHFW